MKKITALLLALVMALSLAACGSKDDSKQLVGTWQCALDLTEKYKLEDGRLYLAETDGSFTQADSIGCTVSGSTMQWTDDQGALADLETELGVSPDLSWTKQ